MGILIKKDCYVATLLAMTNRLFPFSRFTVYGSSMFPALKDGQEILAWRWFYHPKKGDIIVIYKNGRELVKRIIKIEKAGYFVEGDNKDSSTDSRSFGPLSRSQIIGKVILIVR